MFKLFLIILSLSFSTLFAHCDGCGPEEHNTNGSLSGNVKYQGKVPNARPLKMDADPVCGAAHTEPVYRQSFIMNEEGYLKNVMVYS